MEIASTRKMQRLPTATYPPGTFRVNSILSYNYRCHVDTRTCGERRRSSAGKERYKLSFSVAGRLKRQTPN